MIEDTMLMVITLYRAELNRRFPFLVGTLSLVSYAEENIVAPNLLIWELDLQGILL